MSTDIVRTVSTTSTTEIIGGKTTTKTKTIEHVTVRSIRSDRIDVSVVGLFVRALEQAQAPGNAKISAHRSDVGHLIQLTAEWRNEIAQPAADPTGLTVPCDGTCGDTSPHDAHLADGALERLAAEQPAEPATDNQRGPYCMKRTAFGWCYRPVNHAGDCDSAPELTALADDEPGQEDAEAEDDPAFRDTEADRDTDMRAALGHYRGGTAA